MTYFLVGPIYFSTSRVLLSGGVSDMTRSILRFLTEEDAATAVEYAVMLAMILLSAFATISVFGSESGGLWGGIDTDLQGAGLGN